MNQSRYQAVLQKVDSFPTLPSTAMRVLNVVNNPESSATDLMETVMVDQAMSTTILKVANSAFFGRPREVASLETAIMVLGFNEVQSIVLGKALFNTFKELTASHEEMKKFWNHSFTCGLCAKIIARQHHFSEGEFFIAGLIHDIGKLALLLTFPHDYLPEKWLNNSNLHDRVVKEKDNFGISHDTVGGKMLEKWLFPKKLVDSVAWHHNISVSSPCPPINIATHLADLLSHYLNYSELQTKFTIIEFIYTFSPDFFHICENNNIAMDEDFLHNCYDLLKLEYEENIDILSLLSS